MQISPVITAADTKPSDIATKQYPQGIPYDPTVYSSNSVARKGALAVGNGSQWAALEVGTAGYVLTCSAAAADGVAWSAPYTLPAALTGTTLVVTGGIGTNGVTTPPAKAAYPGLATGTDAVMVNAITAILVALGFCASS